MTRPHYDDISTIPLPTDRELIPHVQAMIERAMRRQVWIMLLDEESRPLPIVIPIEVDPEAHPDDSHALISALSCVLLEFSTATLVVTLERPGPTSTLDRDRRWLRSLREACVDSGHPFRGPYLMLGDHVVQVAPDDYVGVPWAHTDYDGSF